MITIAIAEDHQALIDGMKVFLEYEKGISIVGEANNGASLLEIVRLKRPHVVLTDIRMPVMDGISATKAIKQEFPHCKVIAFTMFDQEEAITQMQAAGASGYILKSSSLKEVTAAIKAVYHGETYFNAGQQCLAPKQPEVILSKRETEILKLVGQGKTSQEIADILIIEKSTVDTHRKNILRKLNLQGKNDLLRYSVEKKYDF